LADVSAIACTDTHTTLNHRVCEALIRASVTIIVLTITVSISPFTFEWTAGIYHLTIPTYVYGLNLTCADPAFAHHADIGLIETPVTIVINTITIGIRTRTAWVTSRLFLTVDTDRDARALTGPRSTRNIRRLVAFIKAPVAVLVESITLVISAQGIQGDALPLNAPIHTHI